MSLPPGPRAPRAWQTLAWMARPEAFLRAVHARFGDPATIRTFWTEEPMVLFSGPAAVRDIFGLDPSVAPAGESWEFLRPFAGPHSILLLDGDPHVRERRLMQGPFHGERMRAFAPLIHELAARELATWRGRVRALDRMRALTLEVILRVVFGLHSGEAATPLRASIESTLASVRSLPRLLAMALLQRDLGPHSPWGQFRRAVEGFDALLFDWLARQDGTDGSSMLALLLAQRDEEGRPPSPQHIRDQLVALLVGGHDSSAASLAWGFERLAHHPHVQARLRDGDPAYSEAVVKETLRIRPALTIAPRRLLAPARIGGHAMPAGVQVAACLWLALRRADLWPDADAFRPERWLDRQPPAPPWIPFGGGVRRCAGAPFAEMEMREVLGAAGRITIRPARSTPERATRSMLVLVPHRGAEVVVG